MMTFKKGAVKNMNEKLTLILHDGEEDSLLKVIQSIQIGETLYAVVKDHEERITFLRHIKMEDNTERLTDDLTDQEYKYITDIYMASQQEQA